MTDTGNNRRLHRMCMVLAKASSLNAHRSSMEPPRAPQQDNVQAILIRLQGAYDLSCAFTSLHKDGIFNDFRHRPAAVQGGFEHPPVPPCIFSPVINPIRVGKRGNLFCTHPKRGRPPEAASSKPRISYTARPVRSASWRSRAAAFSPRPS